MSQQQNTHRVVVFADKTKNKAFPNITQASQYANRLLEQGIQCRIYPIKPRRIYTDILIERELKEREERGQ